MNAHEEWLTRFDSAGDALDADAWLALLAEDHVQTDHRPLGWETLVGRAAMAAMIRGMRDMWPEGLAIDRELVLAADDVHVAHEVLRGTAVGGIETENEWWAVRQIVDGLAARCDVFGDEAAALDFAGRLSSRTA